MKKIIKNIYKRIPLKRELFSFFKKIWSPPESVYQHLYFNGIIKVKVNDVQNFKMMHYGYPIENDLFWKGLYGSWEKQSIKLWTDLSKKSKVIFDIGANTGVYSMVAKAVNPNAVVHAFEPFEAIYKKMVHNAGINDFQIHTNCKAVSNYTGDGVIYTEDADFAYSVTVNKNLWVKDGEPIKLNIKTITLKEYIKQNNITSIDLMKIDVETHEPEVMEGFEPYFKQFKPILLIEILNDEIAKKLSSYFDPKAYGFYNIDEQNGIRKTASLLKSDFYNYLIVPIEKENLMPILS
ncbi:MAG TPA: FkbM family methyltransferase [Hanamia sp.]